MKTIYVLIIALFVLALNIMSQNKIVLVEEGTGTWCSWCPSGYAFAEDLLETYPDQVLFVALHISDPMEIEDTLYSFHSGLSSLPSANVDRIFLGEAPEDWQSKVSTLLASTPPADITVSRTYNSGTRELSVLVSAEFYTSLNSGDYRLGAIVVEDAVMGPAPLYSQSNSYSGGAYGSMGGYGNLPNPVPASLMVYDHTARALLSEYDGEINSLPAEPQAGQTYDYAFSYTIPEEYDDKYIRVYGYLTDASTGEILNAGASQYASGDFNAVPFFHSDTVHEGIIGMEFSATIYCHDPDNHSLTITSVNSLPAWLALNSVGDNDAVLTGTPNETGQFEVILELSDGVVTNQQSFVIEIDTLTEYWEVLGDLGFSNETSEFRVSAAINDSTEEFYAMGVTAYDFAFVYKYDSTGWNKLGDNIAAYPFDGKIAVNPVSGNVWLYVKEGNWTSTTGKVYEFTNGSWAQIGNNIVASGDVNIQFTDDGQAIILQTGLNNGEITAFKYNGTNWDALPALPTTSYYGWAEMKLNNHGNPIVLVAEFSGYTGYSRVLEFDGSDWIEIGGKINPNEMTSGSSSSLHKLAIGSNNEIYAALAHNHGTYIYEWTGNQWDTIAYNIDNGVREVFDLEIGADNKLYCVYQSSITKAICSVWDGSSWEDFGIKNFTQTIGDMDLVMTSEGKPYLAYVDLDENGGKLSAMRYLVTEEDTTTIDTTGTHVLSFTNEIKLYPNPVQNNLFFSNNSFENQRYLLFDIYGKNAKAGIISERKLNVAELSSGVYFLKIIGAHKVFRFMKQ